MIVVPIKEGDNIERALKKLKRKFEKTGVVKELRERHIGEFIHIIYVVLRIFVYEKAHNMAANESGTAGNDDILHTFIV